MDFLHKYLSIILFAFLFNTLNLYVANAQTDGVDTDDNRANWIGLDQNSYDSDEAPQNLFTYFRKVVDLEELPEDSGILFGADSNALLWINGQTVRRKVSRYDLQNISVDVVNTGPYLKKGENVFLVLHHNWGNVQTFQRTGNRGPALFINSDWVQTNHEWRMIEAPEFEQHDKQILGVPGTPRVRYPIIIDARDKLEGNLHDKNYNDSFWDFAVPIKDGFYPDQPQKTETRGQHEYPVIPSKVLASGKVSLDRELSDDPALFGLSIKNSNYTPNEKLTYEANNLLNNKPLVIEGKKGESFYITFDFFKPIHGYPYLQLEDTTPGIKIDIGYTEISRSQYDGSWHVDQETGWIDPTGVVGDRYADRYVTKRGSQYIEIPDERTVRWMMIRVHFQEEGLIKINETGMIRSQYPVDFIGSFSSGNDHIDQLINLSLTHAIITMTDSYQDTPGREDGQWYEDARLRAELTARWFGDIKLREFMIRTVAESQRKDGRFHDFPPSNYPFLSTYDWNMQWVAILYDQYMWTGDLELLRKYWSHLELFWENVLGLVNEDGLWITNEVRGDIRVSESLEPHQSSGIVTPSIIERLGWSIKMADDLGKTDRSDHWRKKHTEMKSAFKKYHIVDSEEGTPAYVANRFDPANNNIDRGLGQAAQAVPVFTNLLTEKESKEIISYLFTEPLGNPPVGADRWNNPTFIYRVLLAMTHIDMNELAVNHLIERFSQYLPGHPNNPIPLELQGPYGGPLPEYWISREDAGLEEGEILQAQPVDDTGSHGWASIPLLWLHDSLLGVKIDTPGGKIINVEPQLGGLPYVQGYTNTPKGIVWVSLNPQELYLEVEIPVNVTANVYLPDLFDKKRVKVLKENQFERRIDNLFYQIEESGKYKFIGY